VELKGPILAVAGPTAVGKSAVALHLAERWTGEIVSVDSMQVYRGLDIGTAKPSPTEQARVRHHLIDVLDLHETFDAHQFCERAVGAIKTIVHTGRVPVLCGGSGLYFKALWMGLGKTPPANLALRRSLEAQPLEPLLAELRRRDPEAYAGIDRANKRRVVRALEVVQLTGLPYAQTRIPWPRVDSGKPVRSIHGFDLRFIGLRREAADLQKRIEQRVDCMFEAGLVEETRKLLGLGLAENPTARNALGYRQVIDYIQGRTTLEETRTAVKILTRQFAKRQMTWFRRQLPVTWLDLPPGEPPEGTAERIAQGKQKHCFESID
jgi:tRNA dimethylallyltransferase